MKKVFVLLAALLALASCKGFKGNPDGKPSSTGRARDIIVIYDNKLWKTSLEDEVNEILAPPMRALTQNEPLNFLREIPRSSFTHLYRMNRNLLFLELSDSILGVQWAENIYATPQTVIKIMGKDGSEIASLLRQDKDKILKAYKDGDIAFLQKTFSEFKDANSVYFKGMGASIDVPSYYYLAGRDQNFLWFMKEITKGSGDMRTFGTVNILFYRKKTNDQTTLVNPLAVLDSVTQRYVHGQREGSYVKVEYNVPFLRPITDETEIDGAFAQETRGIWRTENDFMGGPFINYTIYDDKDEEIYGLQGFVYFPSEEKAHYIFELEAIFRTFRFE